MAAALADGRPVVAQTDIYHLPYYSDAENPPVHFIGHGIVLTGIDLPAGTVTVADIAAQSLLTIPLTALAAAMGSEMRPMLSTPYRWTAVPRLTGSVVTAEALRQAIGHTCTSMLDPIMETLGLPALRRMADALPAWAAAPDWAWCARFAYQAIEKRGTGGGGFRHLYADFLQEAASYIPELDRLEVVPRFHELGNRWSSLAQSFKSVFVEGNPRYFQKAAELAADIAKKETAVLQDMAQAVG
jgi:hypothetical protein